MKQIVVISGKGGTGKTILTACFAALAEKKVMADADVDAANLHILLHPHILETLPFTGGKKAVLDSTRCTGCGECLDVCRFDALHDQDGSIVLDGLSCEGCAVCSHICPPGAITMTSEPCGETYVSRTAYGPFVHARLGTAEENSGKLVSAVRNKAKEIAEKSRLELIIIDGPPGIGCPVIASLSGTDLALIVTEPTLSGIHDMERVVGLARHFRIPSACCINKWDINPENTSRIEDWCRKNSVPVAGKIRFDEGVISAMVRTALPLEEPDSPVSQEIREIWANVTELLPEEK
jgi:MinD superfamily P-loop ATPase